jgi:hypothetical protein
MQTDAPKKRVHSSLGELAAFLEPKFTPTLMLACDRFLAQLVLNNILERDVPGVPKGQRAA